MRDKKKEEQLKRIKRLFGRVPLPKKTGGPHRLKKRHNRKHANQELRKEER